ncbi:MAG TPA: tRNA pseudouridine(38-40) synthase TruA [Acidiferrobacter sp.]|nr:tRNA pseudouridine(38-40) synthase TruA [Acidiferrobacter sp.]
MTRWALGVEYNGAPFSGWQSQVGVVTVQDVVQRALTHVADEPIRVVAAGRTDAGVHALCQVIHFDTTRERRPSAFVHGANSHLSRDVSVLWAQVVAGDFSARFSALGRTYRYVILNRRVRPGLWAARVSFDYRPLDIARMQEAALALLGRHDFTSFRASQCQAKSPVRTVRRLMIERLGPFVIMTVEADAFLHHMVRNIAGVLTAIGAGERPVPWAHEVLVARDRALGGLTATPDGLYFQAVQYPDHYGIPILQDAGPWAGLNP